MTDLTPTPGSDAAVALGCTCPRMDNAHGRGAWGSDGDVFFMSGDCPLHGFTATTDDEEDEP